MEVIVRGGELQLVSLQFLDMPAAVLEATDLPHEFIIKEPNNPRETARFELDAEGNVKRLWLRNEYVLPKQSGA